MPRRLIYAREALADLDAIRGSQTQPGSGPAAIRRLRAIRAAIKRLKQYPCLYPVGDHAGVRELRTPAATGPPATCGYCECSAPASPASTSDAFLRQTALPRPR